MLERDVDNMTNYYGLSAPELLDSHYAPEIWALYEDGKLHPDHELTGQFEVDTHSADVDSVMLEIKAVLAEEATRQERLKAADQLD